MKILKVSFLVSFMVLVISVLSFSEVLFVDKTMFTISIPDDWKATKFEDGYIVKDPIDHAYVAIVKLPKGAYNQEQIVRAFNAVLDKMITSNNKNQKPEIKNDEFDKLDTVKISGFGRGKGEIAKFGMAVSYTIKYFNAAVLQPIIVACFVQRESSFQYASIIKKILSE